MAVLAARRRSHRHYERVPTSSDEEEGEEEEVANGAVSKSALQLFSHTLRRVVSG